MLENKFRIPANGYPVKQGRIIAIFVTVMSGVPSMN